MKLLLFVVVLAISTSKQQESKETLNETLDRLIKQANKGHIENVPEFHINKNNSRVFYLNSPESSKQIVKDGDTKETNVQKNGGSPVSIIDILHALGLKDSTPEDEGKSGKANNFKEITFTVEDNTKSQSTTTDTGIQKLLGQLISKSGTSASGESFDTMTDVSENLLHKYPEIIIDKIIHYNDVNQAKSTAENKALTEKQIDHTTENQNLKIAQELKSLLVELQKMKAETASDIDKISYQSMPQDTETDTQIPCGAAIVQYSTPCESLLLNKLTDYQYSRRSGSPNLDANLQLNIWGAQNARRNALMRISMIQKLKRIQLITQLINDMKSRSVYRPLYGYF